MNIDISRPGYSGLVEPTLTTDSMDSNQIGKWVFGSVIAVGIIYIVKLAFDHLLKNAAADTQNKLALSKTVYPISDRISGNRTVQDVVMHSRQSKSSNSSPYEKGIFQGVNDAITSFSGNNLQESENIISSEVDAYVDIAEFANAFVFGKIDENSSFFYYHRIPYLLESQLTVPCKKLTFGDGSPIPLTIGDFLIPIVIKDPIISGSLRDEHSRLYLPSNFMRELKIGTPVSLKYGGQNFNLYFKDFDPDFEGTSWSDRTGSSLINEIEYGLYNIGEDREARASHPLRIMEKDLDTFEDLVKAQPRYTAPSKILEQTKQTKEKAALLQEVCKKHSNNILKAKQITLDGIFMPKFNISEKGSATFLGGNPTTLQCDDLPSFDLKAVLAENENKNIEVLFFDCSHSFYNPKISTDCLSLYFKRLSHKKAVLSISDESLVLWQEHLNKQEIKERLLKDNEGIEFIRHSGPDATLTYIPFSLLNDLGIDMQQIIEGLDQVVFENGFLKIPYGQLEPKVSIQILEKSENFEGNGHSDMDDKLMLLS